MTVPETKRCEQYNHRWDTDLTKGNAKSYRVQFDGNGQEYITYFCGPHAGGQKRKDKAPWRGVTLTWWYPIATPTEQAVKEAKVLWTTAMAEYRERERVRVEEARKAEAERERMREEQRRTVLQKVWEKCFAQFTVNESGGLGNLVKTWTVIGPEGSPTSTYVTVTRNDDNSPWYVHVAGYMTWNDEEGLGHRPTDLAFMMGQAVQEAAAYAEFLNEKAKAERDKSN